MHFSRLTFLFLALLSAPSGFASPSECREDALRGAIGTLERPVQFYHHAQRGDGPASHLAEIARVGTAPFTAPTEIRSAAAHQYLRDMVENYHSVKDVPDLGATSNSRDDDLTDESGKTMAAQEKFEVWTLGTGGLYGAIDPLQSIPFRKGPAPITFEIEVPAGSRYLDLRLVNPKNVHRGQEDQRTFAMFLRRNKIAFVVYPWMLEFPTFRDCQRVPENKDSSWLSFEQAAVLLTEAPGTKNYRVLAEPFSADILKNEESLSFTLSFLNAISRYRKDRSSADQVIAMSYLQQRAEAADALGAKLTRELTDRIGAEAMSSLTAEGKLSPEAYEPMKHTFGCHAKYAGEFARHPLPQDLSMLNWCE